MLVKLLVLIILKLVKLHLKPLMIRIFVIDDAAVQVTYHDFTVNVFFLERDVVQDVLVYGYFRLVGVMLLFYCRLGQV
jgi:hypothetical protein